MWGFFSLLLLAIILGWHHVMALTQLWLDNRRESREYNLQIESLRHGGLGDLTQEK